MNSDEARKVLETCRPGGADAQDPRVCEAMEQVRRDPELRLWWADQQAFDSVMAEGLKSIPVPGDLRAALLTGRPRVVRRPASWWRPAWGGWQVRAAAAAAIGLLAAVLAGAFTPRGPTPFADFRRQMVEDGWGTESHLAYRSADFPRVKQWLARNGGPTAFSLPSEFRQRRLHGCNVVDVDGHPVAVLCFAQGSRHLHLFVTEGVQFAGLPQRGMPDFERCGHWKTTAWQDGKRTFVLTGMDYPTFVTTFRKAGRWTMSG